MNRQPQIDAFLLAAHRVAVARLHEDRQRIDGAIGSLCRFDETLGCRADGVGPETAVMQADWVERASLHPVADVTGRLDGRRFETDTPRARARGCATEAAAA